MGMGVFFLAAMVLGAKFSLIDANIIKVFVVGAYTILVVAIFQWNGLINWRIGLILAVGQTIGAWLAATFASRYPKADYWAYILLVVVIILAIIKMFNLTLSFKVLHVIKSTRTGIMPLMLIIACSRDHSKCQYPCTYGCSFASAATVTTLTYIIAYQLFMSNTTSEIVCMLISV